jgi:nitrogen regulatory protein PII-like uncharacterized protein
MAAPIRKKTDPQSRKFLLAELQRIAQMIASFVQCEKAQKASKVVAAVLGRHRYNEQPIPTPSALLPWLQ